jgi:hypothetical protein
MYCHVDVRTAVWHFTIGPHTDRKMPKMGDMWQLLLLACHHADVIMTQVDI